MNGEILKTLRKERMLTQATLAEKLGLEKSTIAKYELSGVTPSPEILMKLADLFDVSVDYLLGRVTKRDSEIAVALCSPAGYDKLTDEQREQIDKLVEMFSKTNEV